MRLRSWGMKSPRSCFVQSWGSSREGCENPLQIDVSALAVDPDKSILGAFVLMFAVRQHSRDSAATFGFGDSIND